jgi:hypothetical protein
LKGQTENICYKKASKNKDKYRQRKYKNDKDRKEKKDRRKERKKGILTDCRE